MSFERLSEEAHDTLDGIPNPAENPFLFGHGALRARLASAYRAGKFAHAWLFTGPQGVGKATLAFHLAYHLLLHPSSSAAPPMLSPPDKASSLFRQIAIGAHPAVLHLARPPRDKAKGFKSVITADEVRKVNRFLQRTSHDGAFRVVIVDAADDMNGAAANALLKNLEEPPSRTVFLLVAHNPGRLLPTIRSRCQEARFLPLSDDDLGAALAALGSQGSPALLARARGSVRRALLLANFGGGEITSATESLARAGRLDAARAHRLADKVGGRDQNVQLALFNEHALDLLADEAAAAARAGHLSRSDRLSAAWQSALETIRQTEAYNLDRKQYALEMIFRLNDLLRA